MNIEESVKDCISKELEKGIIEKVLTRKLEKCIDDSVNELFTWNGVIKRTIENKLKEILVPYLEGYNYSDYITKIDDVLTDILNHTAIDNKKVLENFKHLMVKDIPKEIKLSEIFEKWCEHCEHHIDKDELDMDFEGCYVTVHLCTEDISSTWSDIEKYIVTFECEEDENLNVEFMLTKWKKFEEYFSLTWDRNPTLNSLRRMSEFELFMMNLKQNYSEIILDKTNDRNDLFIECEE